MSGSGRMQLQRIMGDFQRLVYSIYFLAFCIFCQFLRFIKIQFVDFQAFIYLKFLALLRSERYFERLCVSVVEISDQRLEISQKGERRRAKGGVFCRRNEIFTKCYFLHFLSICKNQLIDFQVLIYLKLCVVLRSERLMMSGE